MSGWLLLLCWRREVYLWLKFYILFKSESQQVVSPGILFSKFPSYLRRTLQANYNTNQWPKISLHFGKESISIQGYIFIHLPLHTEFLFSDEYCWLRKRFKNFTLSRLKIPSCNYDFKGMVIPWVLKIKRKYIFLSNIQLERKTIYVNV